MLEEYLRKITDFSSLFKKEKVDGMWWRLWRGDGRCVGQNNIPCVDGSNISLALLDVYGKP
jgi:hypothetical protein